MTCTWDPLGMVTVTKMCGKSKGSERNMQWKENSEITKRDNIKNKIKKAQDGKCVNKITLLIESKLKGFASADMWAKNYKNEKLWLKC